MINLENIKSIVNSSLEYSKDQSKIQRVPVDIISLLDTIAENQADKDFPIKVKHQTDNFEMAVEIELFKRMLKNIIENAKKYATGCMIRTKFTNHHFAIAIIDNGLGVPEKFISQLTTPYFRVDPARSSQTGGSGLGLAIVKKIVELHDGSVHFENVSTGGFKVLLRFEGL